MGSSIDEVISNESVCLFSDIMDSDAEMISIDSSSAVPHSEGTIAKVVSSSDTKNYESSDFSSTLTGWAVTDEDLSSLLPGNILSPKVSVSFTITLGI